jgi:hypothetical protein
VIFTRPPKGPLFHREQGQDLHLRAQRAWILQAALLRFGSGWQVVREAVWGAEIRPGARKHGEKRSRRQKLAQNSWEELPEAGWPRRHCRDSSTRPQSPFLFASSGSGFLGVARKDRFRGSSLRGPKGPGAAKLLATTVRDVPELYTFRAAPPPKAGKAEPNLDTRRRQTVTELSFRVMLRFHPEHHCFVRWNRRRPSA